MPKSTNGTSVTANPRSAQILRDAAGKQVGVFLDIKTYQHLLRQAEDAFDARLISETLDDEKIPWEVAKAELKRLGKI